MQTVAMKPISLLELPPKPSEDVTSKLFPGFEQTEVRTSGATIPVLHKGDGPAVLLLHGYPEIRPTCEVILTESPVHLQKQIDPQSGLALIRP